MQKHNRAVGVFGVLAAIAASTCAQEAPVRPRSAPAFRLEYQLPPQEAAPAAHAVSSKDASAALLASAIRCVQRRLPRAVVEGTGERTFTVDLPEADAKAVEAIRARIEQSGSVEMRVVATTDYAPPGCRFDLDQERSRLEDWLRKGGKELVAGTPLEIRKFNEDPEQGPLAPGHLAWYPRIIQPSPGDTTRWAPTWTADSQLASAVVAVFDARQWNDGVVLPELGKKELLEYVAINLHERFFTGGDLDPDSIKLVMIGQGDPVVEYSLRAAKGQMYAEWSEKYIGRCSALIVNGEVRIAPRFAARIPGRGQIQGLDAAELDELAAILRGGTLPVTPVFAGMQVLGRK